MYAYAHMHCSFVIPWHSSTYNRCILKRTCIYMYRAVHPRKVIDESSMVMAHRNIDIHAFNCNIETSVTMPPMVFPTLYSLSQAQSTHTSTKFICCSKVTSTSTATTLREVHLSAHPLCATPCLKYRRLRPRCARSCIDTTLVVTRHGSYR